MFTPEISFHHDTGNHYMCNTPPKRKMIQLSFRPVLSRNIYLQEYESAYRSTASMHVSFHCSRLVSFPFSFKSSFDSKVLFLGLNQARLNRLPVDDVPDGTDVTRTDVPVIDVISVLPDVDA